MKRLIEITEEDAAYIIDNAASELDIFPDQLALGVNLAVKLQNEIEPIAETDERLTAEEMREKCRTIYSL